MSIELQNLDCNCNNCKFMIRDQERFKEHKAFLNNHYKKDAAGVVQHVPLKPTLNFGHCQRYHKDISFMPNIMMPENFNCFENRR